MRVISLKTVCSLGMILSQQGGGECSGFQFQAFLYYRQKDIFQSKCAFSTTISVDFFIFIFSTFYFVRERRIWTILRPVHTIHFYGSDFCWFRKSDRVNTLIMTFHTQIPNFEKKTNGNRTCFISSDTLPER